MDGQVECIETDAGVLGGVLLDACPFCGEAESYTGLVGIAVEIDEDGEATELSAVACADCGACGPMVEGGLSGAARGWNRRP